MTENNLTYPTLKQPPPPEFAFLDLDSILFKAAQAGEQVWYVAKDENDKEVKRFDSAKGYSRWLWELENGFDFSYKGDLNNLTRHTEYEILPVGHCYKSFDKLLKEWVKLSGCSNWKGYIGKQTGAKVFRYGICTLNGYKSGRDPRKPHHLESVRKYAKGHPNIKTAIRDYEVDDYVVMYTERMKHKAVCVGVDKDSRQVVGSYVLIIDQMDKPEFSSSKICGTMIKEGGKVKTLGHLALLHQMLVGDKVDGIGGLHGWGEVKSFNLLNKYSGACIKHLPEAIKEVAHAYFKHYGDNHTYPHCYTGEALTRSWRDIFKENLMLLYMIRYKDDEGDLIMQYVPEVFE